jgi:hypothetical protein
MQPNQQFTQSIIINSLIQNRVKNETSQISTLNLEIAAEYLIALKKMEKALYQLFSDHSKTIVITNLNFKRYQQNHYYILLCQFNELLLSQHYPTHSETSQFSIPNATLTIQKEARDDSFLEGFAKQIQDVCHDTKQNDSFLFQEPVDPNGIKKPIIPIKKSNRELHLNDSNDLFSKAELVECLQEIIGPAERYFEIVDQVVFNDITYALQSFSDQLKRLLMYTQKPDHSLLLSTIKEGYATLLPITHLKI